MKDYVKIGIKIAYLLRHDSEDLVMDRYGYVKVLSLLKKMGITHEELDFIVETNNKKRFEYSEDRTKIRARQGHSIEVDVGLKLTRPPKKLYHGTTSENYEKIIRSKGLDKMKRLHVHMTDDPKEAYNVGKRYSKYKEPLILEIHSDAMNADGYKFYQSANGVWLTDNVPLKYLTIYSETRPWGRS